MAGQAAGRADRGRFITLEGGEGAGKSTQIRLLADFLRAQGRQVVTTREPGGSPGAEEIRGLLVTGAPGRWQPLTEALLLNAARHQHLEETIRPALAVGAWVLCDRYADSTRAYQGAGHGLDLALLDRLDQIATGGQTPDLTLILDLAPELGLQRAGRRNKEGAEGGEDRYERMQLEFHRRLRDAYRRLAGEAPQRCVLIDATAPVEQVQAEIRRHVGERLGEPA